MRIKIGLTKVNHEILKNDKPMKIKTALDRQSLRDPQGPICEINNSHMD